MNILERLRPVPIPAIHPMPEYLASGQRAEWYEDTKQVLQVPWGLWGRTMGTSVLFIYLDDVSDRF